MTRNVLIDEQWKRIEPLLSGKPSDCGVTGRNNRLFLEAVLWVCRTGAPWRDLPEALGSWHTVYTRYNRWSKKGRWEAIFKTLSEASDFEYLMIDGLRFCVETGAIWLGGNFKETVSENQLQIQILFLYPPRVLILEHIK